MRIFKNLFSFYINSSIHVAFAVVALVAVTQLHFSLSFQGDLLLFIFFGTVTGYNFVKYANVAKLHHRSLANNLKVIQIFSLFSFVATMYYALRISREALLLALCLGLVTVLYAVPVAKGAKNLRAIKGIKVHVISFIWAGVTVLMPLATYRNIFDTDVVLEFVQRYLLVLVLLLPFEIRDLKYDRLHLGTIPQRMGVKKTRRYGFFLLAMFVMAEFLQKPSTTGSAIAVVAVAAITAAVIFWSGADQSRYFAAFWVEAIPLLWFLLLWIFEMRY